MVLECLKSLEQISKSISLKYFHLYGNVEFKLLYESVTISFYFLCNQTMFMKMLEQYIYSNLNHSSNSQLTFEKKYKIV